MNLKKGYLLTISSAVGFGMQPLLASLLYSYRIGNTMLALLRVLCMVPFFGLMVCLKKNESFSVRPKQLVKIAFLSLTGTVLTTSMLFSAYTCIDTGTATTLHFTYPIVVLVLGTVIYREKLTPHMLICFCICTLGVIMFCNPVGNFTWKGFALAIGSGLTYGVYVLFLDKSRILQETGFFSFTFYFSLISSVMLLPIVGALGDLNFKFEISGWFYVVLLAGICGVLATVMAQRGICEIGSRKASVLSTMEAVTSIVLGAIFMDEQINLRTVLGIALILTSTFLLAIGTPADSHKE